MKKSLEMNWQGGMAFQAQLDGHQVIVDASLENDGNDLGPRPKMLMLVALGGCTGMDVVSILKKMRVEIESFTVKMEGNVTEEHPKHFDALTLIYEFKGKESDREKIQKAVDLSFERYCGVSAVYKKAMPMDYKIVIVE